MTKRGHTIMRFIVILLLPFCQAKAQVSPVVQIYTHFNKVIGHPSWLIMIQDADSNAVYPYLFTITKPNNNIIIYTHAENYHIISILQFKNKKIDHFCQLEPSDIWNHSLLITLKGSLSPRPHTAICYIQEQ